MELRNHTSTIIEQMCCDAHIRKNKNTHQAATQQNQKLWKSNCQENDNKTNKLNNSCRKIGQLIENFSIIIHFTGTANMWTNNNHIPTSSIRCKSPKL